MYINVSVFIEFEPLLIKSYRLYAYDSIWQNRQANNLSNSTLSDFTEFLYWKKNNNNKYSGKIKNTCIKTKDLCVFELFFFAY